MILAKRPRSDIDCSGTLALILIREYIAFSMAYKCKKFRNQKILVNMKFLKQLDVQNSHQLMPSTQNV